MSKWWSYGLLRRSNNTGMWSRAVNETLEDIPGNTREPGFKTPLLLDETANTRGGMWNAYNGIYKPTSLNICLQLWARIVLTVAPQDDQVDTNIGKYIDIHILQSKSSDQLRMAMRMVLRSTAVQQDIQIIPLDLADYDHFLVSSSFRSTSPYLLTGAADLNLDSLHTLTRICKRF